MPATVFVDSNVLVYQRDATEEEKQPRADAWIRALWKSRAGRISYQVLHEYYVTVTSKLRPGLTGDEAREDVRHLKTWKPIALDSPVLEDAFAAEKRFGFSFWDALIVSAARCAECTHLLSEDLQDGQDLEGVVVVNPFEHGPEAVL